MTGPIVQKNAQDAFVNGAKPGTNYNSLNRMYLQDGTYGYIFFARIFPLGAKIISAKLRVWNGDVWAGTTGMACHRISSRWTANNVTYHTRPSIQNTPSLSRFLTKSNAPKYTIWEFDVTAIMQNVSDGAPWYGFQLDVTGSAQKWIHSTQSTNQAAHPQLIIEWSDAPLAPTGLSPSSDNAVAVAKPTLRFNFVDVSGNTSMAAYRIQVNGTNDFTNPAFDTGEVASSVPQCRLEDTTFTEVPEGATAWWRVQTKDGAGLWSDWSLPASFKRVSKPALTLSNPPADGIVNDATPPIIWDLAATQSRYRVQILDTETLRVLWDTGEVTNTVETVTPPDGVITQPNRSYTVRVQSWDAVNRESTPTSPAYSEVSRAFVFQTTTTTAPVTSLGVQKDGNNPWYDVTFTSGSAPDAFIVMRDGVKIATLTPAQVLVSGTTYRWRDMKVPGRGKHVWEVLRVVNGKASASNPTAEVDVYNLAPFLFWADGSNLITFLDPVIDPGLSEDSSIVYPNNAPPLVVTQSLWGFVGTASGILTGDVMAGLTAQDLKKRFLAMRAAPGNKCYFVWSDEAIECYLHSMKIRPIPRPNKSTDYEISFGFIQQDYVR